MGEIHEHKNIVDEACRRLLGEDLILALGTSMGNPQFPFTIGTISALSGDFYRSPEDLRKNIGTVFRFLEANSNKLNNWKSLKVEECVILSKQYLDLAIVNYTHFRHGMGETLADTAKNAYAEYLRWHLTALKYAGRVETVSSMRAKCVLLNEALLMEGFALHYLVDLFAAGHMRTPRGACSRCMIALGVRDSKVADIVGGLLAKTQHDWDNKDGLICWWVPTANLTKEQPNPHTAVFGIAYGDDFMACGDPNKIGSGLECAKIGTFRPGAAITPSSSADGNDSPYVHLLNTIIVSITHVAPYLLAMAPNDIKLNSPWPTDHSPERLINDEADRELLRGFLRYCIPNPIHNENPPPKLYVNDRNVLCWKGPHEVKLEHYPLKLLVETSNGCAISGVKLLLPTIGGLITAIAPGAGPVMVDIQLDGDVVLDPLKDGDKIIKLFSVADDGLRGLYALLAPPRLAQKAGESALATLYDYNQQAAKATKKAAGSIWDFLVPSAY